MGNPGVNLPPFVGVVTFDPMSTLRYQLLEQTVRSIEKAFPTSELFLLDNRSSDGSAEAIDELLGPRGIECAECGRVQQRGRWHVCHEIEVEGLPDTNRTPGAGRARLYHHMARHAWGSTKKNGWWCPFWVWSDDDMLWKPGAEAKLRHFWHDAPEDVGIVSGLLEPVWQWNTPRRTVTGGGVNVVVRDSAPGAAWTFNSDLTALVTSEPFWRFGYDFELCKQLRGADIDVGGMDLAEHIGWGYSTHGNDANEHVDVRPLDRERWGV